MLQIYLAFAIYKVLSLLMSMFSLPILKVKVFHTVSIVVFITLKKAQNFQYVIVLITRSNHICAVREKSTNTELFLVRISLYSVRI